MSRTDNGSWVVRPKTPRPSATGAGATDRTALEPIRRRKTRQTANPAFLNSGPLKPSAGAETERSNNRSRRWLALGLAGLVYAAGAAGLWSMLETFEGTTSMPLTPAGDRQILPPIEEEVDVRDARLDRPFIPSARPDTVAASDLQSNG